MCISFYIVHYTPKLLALPLISVSSNLDPSTSSINPGVFGYPISLSFSRVLEEVSFAECLENRSSLMGAE